MKNPRYFEESTFDCEKKARRMSTQSFRRAPVGLKLISKLQTALCPSFQPTNRLFTYRVYILVLTYFTYMTYHLSRKPISVVKTILHRNCSGLTPPDDVNPNDPAWCTWPPFNTPQANILLASLDSAFLCAYAAAMFISGFIAERMDLKFFMGFGMLLSGIFCYLFGIAKSFGIHSMAYLLFVQAGAGIAQTTGWPGCVAVVGKWFGNEKKGLIFGIWNSHTSLGNIFGTLIAAHYVEEDWALSFMIPGIIIGCMGFIVYFFLPPGPQDVGIVLEVDHQNTSIQNRSESGQDEEAGLPVPVGTASLRPSRSTNNTSNWSEDDSGEREPLLDQNNQATSLRQFSERPVTLSQALSIPGVIEFALSLFFAKLVSYTFLFWLPEYIVNTTQLTPKESGDLSTLFDVGGIFGAIMAGYISDHTGMPGITCVCFYILSMPMLMAYQSLSDASYMVNVCLLWICGLLVNAPYALITTAVSAELGTHSCLAGNAKALATVTAIIDGTGSVGAAVGPFLAGVVSSTNGGWKNVFYMLFSCNFLALFLLLRVVKTEYAHYRARRISRTGRSPNISPTGVIPKPSGRTE